MARFSAISAAARMLDAPGGDNRRPVEIGGTHVIPRTQVASADHGRAHGRRCSRAVVGSSALASGGRRRYPAPARGQDRHRSGINCGAPAGSAGVKAPDGHPTTTPHSSPPWRSWSTRDDQRSPGPCPRRRHPHGPHRHRSQLVANGTLSEAQTGPVMDRLGAVKRSLAPGSQTSGDVKAAAWKRAHH